MRVSSERQCFGLHPNHNIAVSYSGNSLRIIPLGDSTLLMQSQSVGFSPRLQ
ncbi:hypothetical protein CA13_17320 [Planctomycetes bacterium CA13]|uniref:Uncharacterized protein n=1 Tax=Novipirellula herctigrandis TaxID=2527986 RepID=A0A5C5YZ02_9BACT|nr:hypothetical protein CA13_17320 [Planctomycetes bacterium CA13]